MESHQELLLSLVDVMAKTNTSEADLAQSLGCAPYILHQFFNGTLPDTSDWSNAKLAELCGGWLAEATHINQEDPGQEDQDLEDWRLLRDFHSPTGFTGVTRMETNKGTRWTARTATVPLGPFESSGEAAMAFALNCLNQGQYDDELAKSCIGVSVPRITKNNKVYVAIDLLRLRWLLWLLRTFLLLNREQGLTAFTKTHR